MSEAVQLESVIKNINIKKEYYVGPLNLTFISNIVVMQTKSPHIQFVVDTVSFVLLCVGSYDQIDVCLFVFFIYLFLPFSPSVLAEFWGNAVQRQAGGRREEEL